jgi:hypothetical protein
MKSLKSSQLKALSEFLNTIAAAWFSAGVISPFFIKPESLLRAILLGFSAFVLALSLLYWSIYVVKNI